MVSIHIDFRETGLLEVLREKETPDVCIVSKNLELGDIQIILNETRVLVFERKTISDLAASVKDGRYKEQKHRLLSALSPHQITYIIEGASPFGKDQCGLSGSAFDGVYINTMYRDKIHVMFTEDVHETALWVFNVATKISKNPDVFVNNEGGGEYHTFCKAKSRKIENITPATCFIMQLCQIPGISHKIAETIQKTYPSFPILISALTTSSEPTKELSKLPLIGTKKAKVICDYLCG